MKSLGLTSEERRLRTNARARLWHKEHREQVKPGRKAYRIANAEMLYKLTKAWHVTHPGYANKQYVKRLETKAGRKKPKKCDVCKRTTVKICFDHDHKTDEFRGWLCDNCNKALGQVNDSSKLLRKLADYVDNHNAKPN